MSRKASAEPTVRDIQRKTRKKFMVEEKIRIVIEGMRDELSVAELCRREGVSDTLYYRWSKEFLEAGKERLIGDPERQATSAQVKALPQENEQLTCQHRLAELRT